MEEQQIVVSCKHCSCVVEADAPSAPLNLEMILCWNSRHMASGKNFLKMDSPAFSYDRHLFKNSFIYTATLWIILLFFVGGAIIVLSTRRKNFSFPKNEMIFTKTLQSAKICKQETSINATASIFTFDLRRKYPKQKKHNKNSLKVYTLFFNSTFFSLPFIADNIFWEIYFFVMCLYLYLCAWWWWQKW